mgnify:CR=1 FL=1
MLLDITINKIYYINFYNMKILKKKTLGTLEVYIIFVSCISAGFMGYKSLLNMLFS